MSELVLPAEGGLGATARGGHLGRAEELALAAVLLAMTVIPIAEIVIRAAGGAGISGSSVLVQHGTLFIGMLGAALAAREKRLLALGTVSFLRGRAAVVAGVLAAGFGAAIAIHLAIGSARFVAVQRQAEATLAYGIPLWIVQAVLPVGFLAIALRLVLHATPEWKTRAASAGIAMLLAALPLVLEPPAGSGTVVAIGALLLGAVAGMPIFAILGGAALVFYWSAEIPIAALAVYHYSLVTNPALPAIPLFTLAGYILAEGGASQRLVRVFDALFGRVRGGPAIVTALACAFFTAFTGGSGVTILALGGLLFPILLASRYAERDALGLLTGAGSLGLLFPPALPIILYAIVAEVSMEQMFLGGILPGILLVVLTALWGISRQPAGDRQGRFEGGTALRAIWSAKWELALPVIVIGALFGGIATAVEAAALTALYALVVETLIHRDYRSVGALRKVFAECGLLVGGVLLILGVALGFTSYLIDAQIPMMAVAWATSSIESRLLFLLLLNVFLLVVGCLMDVYSAIVVVVPLIVPIGLAFGIDPIHLGIIFLANLELGYLTPPVGMNLFISSYRFGKPLLAVYGATVPMLVVLAIGVVLITYVPILTTWLPSVFAR